MADKNRDRSAKQLRAIAFSILLLTMWKVAMCQLPTAAILGTIRDSTGAVIPGAAITAKNLLIGQIRISASSTDGSYHLPALPVGTYEVRVVQSGFRTGIRTGLTLTVSEEAVVNFTLAPGGADQTVTVTEDLPLVNTTSGALGSLMDAARVAELPLNGRNFMDLVLQQPGINQHKNLFVTGQTVGLWFSSNGAPLFSNSYLLDGTITSNLTNATSAAQDGSTLGVEGIREFRLLTNSYSAEYGMTMGSQVTVVTKSGTNRLHGSLLEYFRNSVLDARNFFDYKTAAGNRRLPPFTRNHFGASAGGPIRKDKTFFFGVYEGLRQRLGVTTISSVFPATCHTTANNPCITGGGSVAPVMRPLLDLYPLPNLSGNKFTFPFTQPTTSDYWQGRIDHLFSPSDSLFGRYTINNTRMTDPMNYPQFRTDRFSRNQYATLSENHVFSPTLLSTVRFSFSRTHMASPSPSGLIGPQYSFVPGEEIGIMNIGGVTQMGPNSGPVELEQNIFSGSSDFFYSRGRHSLKFGMLFNRYQQHILANNNASGTVTFANISSFLLGQTSQYSVMTPGSFRERTYRFHTLGFYAEESYRPGRHLTINLGLRYEFITVPNEITGHGATVRDVQHDTQGTIGPLFKNMSLLNFSPRLSFAWDVSGNGKTALRGGFGELYDTGVFGPSMLVTTSASPPFSSYSSVATPSTFTLPLTIPPSAMGKTIRIMDYNLQQPHMLHYHLTVERELPWRMGISLGYAGSRGINLMQLKEGNPTIPQILPDGRKYWSGSNPRVNPNWGSIELHTAGGNSWYNSFQFELNKRLSRQLQFHSSYTWSKVIDETQAQTTAQNSVSSVFGVDPNHREVDRGPADFDVRHNWQFNAIYQLPQPFTGRMLGTFFNGWRASGILSVQSGLPFTPALRTNRSRAGVNGGGVGTGGSNIDRPNLVPGRSSKDIILGGPDRYFDPSAFTLQDAGFLGTAGRNWLTGPGYENLDFSLAKSIPMKRFGEGGALEFRAEFFNILNHANFAMTDTFRQVFAGNANGEAPLPTAGVITSTGPNRSRQIQLALKLLF